MPILSVHRRDIVGLFAGAFFGLVAWPNPVRGDDHGFAAMRRIGRRYLACFPEEADAAWIRRNLRSPQVDFASGDTLWIEGWLVARSEARLCALAALDAGSVTPAPARALRPRPPDGRP